jgi:hypothetical protein
MGLLGRVALTPVWNSGWLSRARVDIFRGLGAIGKLGMTQSITLIVWGRRNEQVVLLERSSDAR